MPVLANALRLRDHLEHVAVYRLAEEEAFVQAGARGLHQVGARGQPVDIMKASSYEMQAYNIECRFKKWAGPSRFPLPDSYCDAQGQARP